MGHTKNIQFLIIDITILNISYFLMNLLAQGRFLFTSSYMNLLLFMNALWLIDVVFHAKYKLFNTKSKKDLIFGFVRSGVFLLFITALFLVIFHLPGFSVYQVFGAFIVFVLFESILFPHLRYFVDSKSSSLLQVKHRLSIHGISLSLMFTDLFLIVLSFFSVLIIKQGNIYLHKPYGCIGVILFGLWFFVSLWTGKFKKRTPKNIYYMFAPFTRAAFLMAAVISVLIFGLRFFHYSRFLVYGTIIFYWLAEIDLCFVYYWKKTASLIREDTESGRDEDSAYHREALDEKDVIKIRCTTPAREELKKRYLKIQKKLFKFIDNVVSLDRVELTASHVLDNCSIDNIDILDNRYFQLLINLHKVNDFRRINRYFLGVHKKLMPDGYFIGTMNTIDYYRKWFYDKFPKFMALCLYTMDFLIRRVLPKLSGINRLYFAFSNGKNRTLSQGELFGRLSFCGFKIIDFKVDDGKLVYIAQKNSRPSSDMEPSYGPLIKLKRIGYSGETIHVYKLRTMHPYSEYIQDYVFDKHGLCTSGKLNGDFRLAHWGKLFRKCFIDELPQVMNFFQGDVGLVGVRALSSQYFDLYPDDLKELRTHFKPGLIPPYYADMPKNFDEIVESERKYLLKKEERPFLTDVDYFFKSMVNIVFKNARSG